MQIDDVFRATYHTKIFPFDHMHINSIVTYASTTIGITIML